MKHAAWIPLALALILATAVSSRGAGEPAVLYPPDLTLSTEPSIRIFVAQPGGSAPTYVKRNGQAVAKLEGQDFQKGEVALSAGMNVLEIAGKPVRVYHVAGVKMDRYEVSQEGGGAPLVFLAYRLHAALDEDCAGCHTVSGGRLEAKGQKAACYACHSDFEAPEEGKTKFVHAPVAAGECTGCHDPHFSARPKLQKLEKGCLECHDAPPDTGTVHYPVKNRECTACHGAHLGPAPKQLVRPGNALCTGCHTEFHAQHRSASVKGKMTRIPDDFPRDGEALSCLGCHKAHQSEERRLFRLPQGKLCQTCHTV